MRTTGYQKWSLVRARSEQQIPSASNITQPDCGSMTKPTIWHVRQVKTQISLGMRPVWSESLLSAWRKVGYLVTHWAQSELWSDWADAQADLSFTGHTHHFVGFVMWWLNFWYVENKGLRITDIQKCHRKVNLNLTYTHSGRWNKSNCCIWGTS